MKIAKITRYTAENGHSFFTCTVEKGEHSTSVIIPAESAKQILFISKYRISNRKLESPTVKVRTYTLR